MLMRMSVLLGLVVCMFVWTGPAVGEGWDHIHLTASDTGEAAAWYAKHFGGKVTKSGEFDAVLFGTNLIKFKPSTDDTSGSAGSTVDHIAFSVENIERLEAFATELREGGVSVGRRNNKKPGFIFGVDPWGTKIALLVDEDLVGFHHVHLKTTLPGDAVAWYTEAFGGKAENFKDAINVQAIRYGDMYLFVKRAVRRPESMVDKSIDHLGWSTKDFDATIKRLRDMGVEFQMEPMEHDGHMIAFVEGPDGVKIEVIEDK